MTEEDGTSNSFRQLREYSRGGLDVEHEDALPIAGLIEDERARRVIGRMAEYYDPDRFEDLPRSFWDTQFAERAIRRYATDAASKAIKSGNQTVAEYLVGEPSYRSDVSGIRAINQLAEWLVSSEATSLIYCAALMGRGKTDFSLLLFEIVHDHFRRLRSASDLDVSVPTPQFACNFRADAPDDVDAEIEEFDRYSELLKWTKGRSSEDELWFIFDEASTELTAQSGANAQDVAETFAPFIKKMRKSGVNMIVIGHDRQDVHPAIRAIASFIDKTGTKTAEIYDGIQSRKARGHVMSISGIPQTSWKYDTDDVASWTWDEAVETDEGAIESAEDQYERWRRRAIAKTYLSTDLSQRDVAEIFDVSQSSVYDYKEEYEEIGPETAPRTPEAEAD